MKVILDIAKESIQQEKVKHAVAVATTSTGASVVGTPPPPTISGIWSDLVVWGPHLAVFGGFAVSCAVFYKTYLDIKLAKIELAKRMDEIKGE